MKLNTHPHLSIIFAALMALSSTVVADDQDSYADKVGRKALNGFANLTTSTLEIPKNIINTTNQSNVAYGFVGGTAKGILNTVGRMMVGLTDLITAPLPTKQFIHPAYVWDDFDADTTYGEVFRLEGDDSAPPSEAPNYQMQ
ncbi:exosortase system-associated protein, TIGR04073 family [Methylomarinum sp. Ch1-1]|uniref:Exosortase system-associated protein, TIGR04073 family n=1 Tax=Methylomarinum roseum TaxID=3067653 RepID=A0AAU7NUQ0_9GAMM|nr:exosortase system-associated protein, TIGR04073 family [Methylomarinum sp. Ch1-1]MDP4519204.1 exosortase system-associated protein, TIGR04073 family [Methylomarinum sp. Ch1-1]